MNLEKLKQILHLSSQPSWVLREPDQEVAPAPVPAAPGTPQPGQPPQPKPGGKNVINAASMERMGNAILPGLNPEGTTPNAPASSEVSAGLPTLSGNISKRMMGKRNTLPMPGSLGYGGRGYGAQ